MIQFKGLVFYNYTPHTITLINGDTNLIITSDGVIRCKETTTQVLDLCDIPVYNKVMGNVDVSLPEPKENVFYIVSLATAQAFANAGRTKDILITNDPIRNEQGQIVGCKSFSKL